MATVDVLVQVLQKSVTSDHKELQEAQQFLEQTAQHDLPLLLEQLSHVLHNGTNEPVIRMQAGLQLKNALYSKDPLIRQTYQARWLAIPQDRRITIRGLVLQALGTESIRPSTAAQCVAYIACAELLAPGGWSDLITVLESNVTNPASTEMMKEATLEAIGYICQDIDPDVLQTQSNRILTAIVHGMKKDEPSNHVKLAATSALHNSLEFTKANFDTDEERHFIMQVVCEATQSSDLRVRVVALQCLVRIMTLYYQYMEQYMQAALFAITVEAMKSDLEDVSLQGIEFWSSVCDEEVDLAIEQSEALETGKPPERTSRFYAKGALMYLAPLLTEIMTKQEDCDDDDAWIPCKAAGVCLMLLSTCCEDDIVQHVLPFVQQNIVHESWKRRDAAVMSFGSILDGPDSTKLAPLVEEALPTVVRLMSDESAAVRDTAAWTTGRVCELLPDVVVKPTILPALVEALKRGLSDVPRVAANICWAFSSLAEAAYLDDSLQHDEDTEEPLTYSLSPYFGDLVRLLLETTLRADGTMHNLRTSAYEAIMDLIKNCAKDCYTVVQGTTTEVLQRLNSILEADAQTVAGGDHSQYTDLQSMLCATLQSVLKKMTKEDAVLISDDIMRVCLTMLQNNQKNTGGVQEDAMQAVGSLIEIRGDGFLQYMQAFGPFLLQGLQNVAEVSVCTVSVNIVGDLCRSLQEHVTQFSDEIMSALLAILGNNAADRSIKPAVLSSLGDVALAVGPHFQKYLQVVLNTLQEASQLEVDRSDYDLVDYLNDLREGCLEAYTGIVQGVKGEGAESAALLQYIMPHAAHLVGFIEKIATDDEKSDAVVSATCGLIGDLAMAFGPQVQPMATKDTIANLLQTGRRSKVAKTKTLATWATKELKKLTRNAS